MRARLAQRLEHRICNAMVIGSIPIAGFFSLFVFIFDIRDNLFVILGKKLEFHFSRTNQENNLFFFYLFSIE